MGLWQRFIQAQKSVKQNKSAAQQERLDEHLAVASSNGKWDEAARAIDQGAQSGRLSGGHSALFWAAKANLLPMVERLAPTAGWGEEANGQNALMAACFEGNVDVAKLIAREMPEKALKAVDEFGASALGYAAAADSASVVEELLSPKANAYTFGKNMRWQAASIAAAKRNADMVELLIKAGWESDSDEAEEWERDSCDDSLAISALCGKSLSTRNTEASQTDHWGNYLMASMLRLGGEKKKETKAPELRILTSERNKRCSVEFLSYMLAAEQAAGTPKKESWDMRVLQTAIGQNDSESGALIIDRFPQLAMTALWNGDTPIMVAMDNGMSDLCDKLAPLSDLSAVGADGRSALRRSIRGLEKHSFTNTVAFTALAKIASQELWDKEEHGIWQDLLDDKQLHWSEEDILLAAMAAASRSSRASLSTALATAVAEGREKIAEFLFPLTNSQENEAAFAREFIQRCSKSEGMSDLVAQRTAVLREAEAIGESARELPASTRAPAKRL